MSKPLLLAGLCCLALAGRASADTLNVQLFPLSGEIRFQNPNAFAVPFVYYSISSTAGALNPNNPPWRSITDYYDVSGNGFIDATSEWSKISATPTELTEGVFIGAGGSLPALRSVTFGGIWNTSIAFTNLVFDIRQQSASITTNIQLAVQGDYDHNGTVNQADYTVWRQSIGSTSVLDADGNIDGVVDTADYAIWRKNLNKSLPGSGSSVGGGQSLGLITSGVPEPTSIALISLAASAFLLQIRRRRAG